ncbi:hypothetical protein AX777_04905 [Sphingobium yanoikuyae]|jgi:hypothetical protein|uniref:Uncharacterized protein n=1 Tax=Sphingobium yanoikuyae TaxID=13690 RepID=A0A177JQD8_SPHYA|nr:hypothetical protein [Sphingobium yanoikuyae]OAH42591.1 hypothetical protein AX777_04905 [Sphingobium yanoikuyae]
MSAKHSRYAALFVRDYSRAHPCPDYIPDVGVWAGEMAMAAFDAGMAAKAAQADAVQQSRDAARLSGGLAPRPATEPVERTISFNATAGALIRGHIKTAAFRLGLDFKEDRRWFSSDFVFSGPEKDVRKLMDMFAEYNKQG